MRLDEMYYTEIEMEGMKEILRDKEEEIKKLKSDLSLVIKERDDNIKVNEFFKKTNSELGNLIDDLKEENNRLKQNAMEDMRVQTKLEERIRFLEQCLDNKEKVNKSMREELQRYKDMLDSGEF